MSGTLACPNCGTKNNSVASFCRKCGTKLAAVGPQSYRPSEARKQKTVVDPNLADPGGGPSTQRARKAKGATVVDKNLQAPRPRKKGTVVDSGLDGRWQADGVSHDRAGHDYVPSENSRIVGFIVSYDLNPLGTYYAIYQGRTVVGISPDESDIVIDREKDKTISGKHCLLLHRRRLAITDENSSNGTWVDTDTVDKVKFKDLYEGPEEEIFKDADFRKTKVKLVQIESEKISLKDNSFFMIGNTLFKVKLVGE